MFVFYFKLTADPVSMTKEMLLMQLWMVKSGSVFNADSTPPTHDVESGRFLVEKITSLINCGWSVSLSPPMLKSMRCCTSVIVITRPRMELRC